MNRKIDRNFSERVNVETRTQDATLEDYATEIDLPLEFLRNLGVHTVDNPWIEGRKAIAVPYRRRNGTLFRERIWQSCIPGESKARRAAWDKRSDKPGGLLYGLDLLPASGCPLILADHESACHLLWYHGFDAVSVAGAAGYYVKRDDAELAEFTITVFPGRGVARSELLKRLSLSKHRPTIKVAHLPQPLEACHRLGTQHFSDTLHKALEKAEPLEVILAREPELDASKVTETDDNLDGNVADNLVTLARRNATFFSAPDETTWGAVRIGNRRETWSLRSKGFRTWLVHQYYRATQKAPNADALNQSMLTLDAVARYDGEQHLVFIRTAEHDEKYYVDLADEAWQAVEIDTSGWRVVSEPPIHFRRPRGMLPLPIPVSGGTISELRAFLNLSEDADFTLIVAWLLAALRPKGPYPLLALAGEPGAAKSTTASILRALVDPNVANLRSAPREERDCWIAANNAGLLAFDNLSKIPVWLSDALCRIATGGGFATRELHTNDDEMLFDAVRPTLLTAVSDVIARSDLADRAIMIELPTIPDTQRVDEERFEAAFEAAKPRILGALFDAMVVGLRNRATTSLEKLPRLADFAVWATACEPAYTNPNGFMEAYMHNAAEAVMGVIEGDAVCVSLLAFLKTHGNNWGGKPEELLVHLNNFAPEGAKREKSWPRNPQTMSGCLRLASPSLRKIGVGIIRRKSHGVRLIEIVRK